MKQLTIILLLAIFHMLPAQAHGNDPLKPARYRILIDLGQWPGCYFMGFCGMSLVNTAGGSVLRPYEGSPTDNILISEDLKSFEIQLSRARLLESQPEKLEYLEGKSTVTFTESFEIPAEVESALKASKDLMIRPGTYPLTFIDGIFTIKFPY